jgi:hypothetical protein
LADALTVPHTLAALVLGVAGLAKLRSPGAAARAVGRRPAAIRVFAAGELGVATWALASGGAGSSVAMAALYAGFALLTLRLAGQGTACGCFGEREEPASPIQSLLSTALSGACIAGAAFGTHGGAWILSRPAGTVLVLLGGLAAAVYAVVLAYSELPALWRSWSPA